MATPTAAETEACLLLDYIEYGSKLNEHLLDSIQMRNAEVGDDDGVVHDLKLGNIIQVAGMAFECVSAALHGLELALGADVPKPRYFDPSIPFLSAMRDYRAGLRLGDLVASPDRTRSAVEVLLTKLSSYAERDRAARVLDGILSHLSGATSLNETAIGPLFKKGKHGSLLFRSSQMGQAGMVGVLDLRRGRFDGVGGTTIPVVMAEIRRAGVATRTFVAFYLWACRLAECRTLLGVSGAPASLFDDVVAEEIFNPVVTIGRFDLAQALPA